MFRALEYLERLGIGERLKGKFRIYADRCVVGTATDEKTKERGLAIFLENTLIHMEFTFVVTDRNLLIQMRKAIDEILEEREKREVA